MNKWGFLGQPLGSLGSLRHLGFLTHLFELVIFAFFVLVGFILPAFYMVSL